MIAAGLQRGQVHRGLGQRPDGPARIQRPIEAGEAGLPVADHGDDFTRLRAGDHNGPDQSVRSPGIPPVEAREAGTQLRLRGRLHQRIQSSEHAQTLAGQIFVPVLFGQLRAHQLQEGRVVSRAGRLPVPGVEVACLRGGGLGGGYRFVIGQDLQHQVAAFQRTLRMAFGAVVGRPLYHRHQQRQLVQFQFVEGPAEVVLAGQPEAVNRTVAVLAHIDLVDISVQQVALFVMPFENQRHRGFADFSPQGAAVVQEIVFDQLLRQRAAPLGEFAAAYVDDDGSQQGPGIDTVMIIEAPVFHRLQRRHQHCRRVVRGHDQPIFTMCRENTSHQQRVETRHCKLRRAAGQPGNLAPGKLDGQR